MRESQRTEGSRRGGKEDRGRGGTADGEGESGENGGTAGQKDEKNDWASELDRRGTFGFIAPLIPDTSGIRRLAQLIPKRVFSLPIPLSVISQSKKV